MRALEDLRLDRRRVGGVDDKAGGGGAGAGGGAVLLDMARLACWALRCCHRSAERGERAKSWERERCYLATRVPSRTEARPSRE